MSMLHGNGRQGLTGSAEFVLLLMLVLVNEVENENDNNYMEMIINIILNELFSFQESQGD